MQPKTWTLDRIIDILLYLGGIALFLWLLDYLSPYLASFFIALFVAYLLEPIVRFFQQRLKVRTRWVAVLLTLFSLVIFLVLIGMLTIPAINREIANMQNLLGGSLDFQLQSLLPPEVLQEIEAYLHSEEVKALLTEENIYNYGVMILSYIWSGLSSAMGIVLGLFSIVTFLLYLVFIMLFYNDFADNWEAVIPPTYREPVVMLVHDVEDGMQIYFRGQALIVFWVCILFAVGFNLIGLPLGILLGIFVGLLNFVPYLQILGLVPALLLAGVQAIETLEVYWFCAGMVILVFIIVQAIQEIILTPRIMGSATGLNPAVILLALSVWGGLFGVIGMVIALPLTTLLINYYKRFVLQGQTLGEEE